MNKKGSTLMETLTAIFILSIAGLMITTGFITVIRVTNDANTIKNQSDDLLSYIEKTDDAELKELIHESHTMLSGVEISNGKGKSVIPKGMKIDLEYNEGSVVSLNSLESFKSQSVYDLFAPVFDNASSLDKDVQSFLKNSDLITEDTPYNKIFTSGFSTKRAEFANVLLPKKEQNKQNVLYIQTFFPWEIYNRINQTMSHGGNIIYLSMNKGIHEKLPDETLHFVYDVEKSTWFYQESDRYKLNYKLEDNFLEGKSCIYFDGNQIKTLNELKRHLYEGTYGWKALEKNTIFDIENPDLVWK